MLHFQPEMASLSTGSVNFPNGIYENPPDFVDGLATTILEYGIKPEVEVFDVAMLYNAANLVKPGLLEDPAHVQFVMGIPNALPARRSLLGFLISELRDVLPDATWTAAGVARHQFEVNQWCLELGGHAAPAWKTISSSTATVSPSATPNWWRKRPEERFQRIRERN